MYLQFNKSKGRNGKEYQSVLLCKKFRDKETGKPKTEVVLNLSKYGLDNKTITALKTSINKTKGILIDSEDIKIRSSILFRTNISFFNSHSSIRYKLNCFYNWKNYISIIYGL